VPTKLAKLPPRLDRSLLHRVLGGGTIGEHDGGEAERWIEQRLYELRERRCVARRCAQHHRGSLLHDRGHHPADLMRRMGFWLQGPSHQAPASAQICQIRAESQLMMASESNPPLLHVSTAVQSPTKLYILLPSTVIFMEQVPLASTFPDSAVTVSFIADVGSPVNAQIHDFALTSPPGRP